MTRRMEDDIMQDVFNEHYSAIIKRRNEYVSEQFSKHGIEHRLTNEKRFPGYTVQQHGDWLNYWADNDTPEGLFICAVSKPFVVQPDYYTEVVEIKITSRFNTMNYPTGGTYDKPEPLNPSPTNKQQ